MFSIVIYIVIFNHNNNEIAVKFTPISHQKLIPYTVNMDIFAGEKFRENVGKTFH